jgi:hypothetical protein
VWANRAGGASGWSEVEALEGEDGAREGESAFLVHDGRCGNGERVHFTLRAAGAA